MSVYEISLKDCLDPAAPPDQVLTISAVDDTAFIQIEKVKEDGATTKKTKVAEISVSIASLWEAVDLLREDGRREDLRPVDVEHSGERAARYVGQRIGWVRT